jgi:hypothetical protein
MAGDFKYEDDLLKHFVRVKGWLPFCKHRLKKINEGKKPNKVRRLKYFSFCAIGAIDVLMLDLERVIKKSTTGRFDTVCYFSRTPEDIVETEKRIPGGIGFAGDFVSTILHQDSTDDFVFGSEPLNIPEDLDDVLETRQKQKRLETRKQLFKSFPFDILNLDLEGYLFRPTDHIPGDLIRALRTVFKWQQLPIQMHGLSEPIDEFTLMFTTKIGPDNLTLDYLQMMSTAIDRNLQSIDGLSDVLFLRTGCKSGQELMTRDFRNMFLIGAPKLIATVLMEEDWYIDPASGIQVYVFERAYSDGQYSMVHLIMNVNRKHPIESQRPPGSNPEAVSAAYLEIVGQLFQNPEIIVNDDSDGIGNLVPSLEQIRRRRRLYYKDE